jgi:hypothetical protein
VEKESRSTAAWAESAHGWIPTAGRAAGCSRAPLPPLMCLTAPVQPWSCSAHLPMESVCTGVRSGSCSSSKMPELKPAASKPTPPWKAAAVKRAPRCPK